MPKAGEIKVAVRACDLGPFSDWLVRVRIPFIRNRPSTLLAGPDFNVERADRLAEIAGVLKKAAVRRRRTGDFTVNLLREHVAALASACDMAFFPRQYAAVLVALRAALRVRRGRPGLTPAELAARRGGRHAIDDRHRKRLEARERHRQRLNERICRDMARGQTLLTQTDVCSEI